MNRPWLKTFNVACSVCLVVLLAVHGLGNSLQLLGVGAVVPSAVGYLLLACAVCHFVLGCVLTFETLREQKRAGAAYWALNKRFWAVRISGACIAVLVVCHVLLFADLAPGPARLHEFGAPELACSLLLVASVAVHVIANLQPLAISLGLPGPHARAVDIGLVVAILVLVFACAFVVYFLRWSVV